MSNAIRYPRVLNAVLNGRWLMQEEHVRLIFDVLERAATRDRGGVASDIQAIEARLGRPLDNTRATTMRGGVAIIPITGPIFRYADLFTRLSGATATEDIALDTQRALDDTSVDAILYNVDSPGGEATGINETARIIFEARQTKPVWAYIEGLGASAAIWLASAAERIVIDATAALGSIGVVLAVADPTKTNAREIEFVSSQSPNKRPDPTTERGRAQLQDLVDDMAAVFVREMAFYRSVSEDDVLTKFGAGGLLVGEKAVASGLADALGSFEGTLAELQGQVQDRRFGARASAYTYFTRTLQEATG